MSPIFYSPDSWFRELVGLRLRWKVSVVGTTGELTNLLRDKEQRLIIHVLSKWDLDNFWEINQDKRVRYVWLSEMWLESLWSQFYPFDTTNFIPTIQSLVDEVLH